jgi:nitrogen regulatory protein P-II 1
MKKIEAIVRTDKLEAVVDKLSELGYAGLTVYNVEGHGRQGGIVEQFRGKEYKLKFIPKGKIEIVVKDDQMEKVIEAITTTAFTGEIGDGKIFVSDVKDVVRVRTKERGDVAI